MIVPRTQRSAPFFTAWCAAEPGPYKAQCLLRSRFCEAALRKGCALHRARETLPSFHGAPCAPCAAYFFTLLASILIDGSSSFVEKAVPTSNGFSIPR